MKVIGTLLMDYKSGIKEFKQISSQISARDYLTCVEIMSSYSKGKKPSINI